MLEDSDTVFEIPDRDEELLAQCRVETFRSGGKGGQHQNTTDSGVRLVHLPTGVRVSARNERSQHRNRLIALARLRRKLEKRNERRPPRIPTAVPPRQKKKRLEQKRRRGHLKKLRDEPPLDGTE